MQTALASIQSAARLLQAMASDGVIPIFARFKGNWNGEPALAVLASILVAQGVLMIGSLNAIAGVLSETGNVLGMMPHPENFVEDLIGGTDGRGLFDSLAA